jgi:serine/threonine-protein kinase
VELTRGTIVGQYRVDRVLGQGGMAVVYSVTHELLGSQHALKLLTTTQRTVRERLLREGRVQAALRHPNVVGVTDVVLVGGSPGLVMEFVDGPTLATLLVHTRLTVGQSVVLMRAVLGGVAAAHRMGVIHRDLKPANVLVEVVDGVVVPRVDHAHRRDDGHPGVHGARADPRREPRRRALGRLLVGRDPL